MSQPSGTRTLLAGTACALALLALPATPRAQEALADQLEELRRVIEAQQATISRQQDMLDTLSGRINEVEAAAPVAAARGEADPVVTSGQERIQLAISGQVNRMINVANDGDDTKIYNLDNDNSSSRLRFEGTGQVTDEFEVGTVIEVELESNASGKVSQDNEDTGSASFNDRKVELVLDHKRYGKLSLGQGDTASNGTAEVDLSGTTVIGYSSVADVAGGLRFFDDDADELSDVSVGDVFSNFDGLSRRDRIRYDTPSLGGFKLSADLVSDQRWSSGLRWSGDFGSFKAAAAAGYSDPGDDSDYIVDGSATVLHVPTGLNFTLSSGTKESDEGDDPYNIYAKAGWIADLVSFGPTAFSVDYAHSENNIDDGDEGHSAGLQAVQNFSDYGAELYAGFRWYDYDAARANLDAEAITVFTVGSRVKF
ncbi:hypothetical protein SH611_19680 [Geminicoccaceae bacterium 1502E]|nr:hypothetical protein [Geminicoccaceae bacterium 1502E]